MDVDMELVTFIVIGAIPNIAVFVDLKLVLKTALGGRISVCDELGTHISTTTG